MIAQRLLGPSYLTPKSVKKLVENRMGLPYGALTKYSWGRFESSIFGRPFIKRFAHVIRPLSALSVTLVYCGHTVAWIKMKLGMEVGRSALGTAEAAAPTFGPCLLRPRGWIDQDAAWYGGRQLAQAALC